MTISLTTWPALKLFTLLISSSHGMDGLKSAEDTKLKTLTGASNKVSFFLIFLVKDFLILVPKFLAMATSDVLLSN